MPTSARRASRRSPSSRASSRRQRLAETRQVAAKLRPMRVHEIGLGAALSNLARSAGVPVELRFDPALLPPGYSNPSWRSTSTGSSRRRSGTPRATVRPANLGRRTLVDDSVRLVVGDDGIGFDASARERGLGLDGMHERASIHGLIVEVRSRPGVGHTGRDHRAAPEAAGLAARTRRSAQWSTSTG